MQLRLQATRDKKVEWARSEYTRRLQEVTVMWGVTGLLIALSHSVCARLGYKVVEILVHLKKGVKENAVKRCYRKVKYRFRP